MDILWAPWREPYVVKATNPLKKRKCVFCSVLKEKKDKKNYIFCRTKYSFAVLNIYPFNGGHSLVIPKRHVDDLDKLSKDELQDLMGLLVHVKRLLGKALHAEAFNVGINLGHVAGAGIPEHLHIHIVPRWKGDMNFMPVLCNTKVMPVSLKTIHERLIDAHTSGH